MKNTRILELQVMHLDFLLDDKISNKILFFFFSFIMPHRTIKKSNFFSYS